MAGILSILGENGALAGASNVDAYAEFFGFKVISINVMNRMTMYMMKVK